MTTLADQMHQITSSIPEPIGGRIATGVEEVRASGVAPGLAVGDTAPSFTLPNATGEHISLATLLADGPVVVTFYRGEWCPYCNLQLNALQQALPEITAAGATLVAISPQAADHSLTMAEKHALSFAVLSDLDQSVADGFKVRFDVTGELEDLQVHVFQNDPAAQNADGRRSLPVASTFIIGTDGTVQAAWVDADWRVRVEPADVVAALQAL